VARAAGKVSAFGAFLDSIADRYGEAALFLGLLLQLHLRGETGPLIACAIALVGSVMVSYARARAEGLGVEGEVGLLQRPERVLLLAAGLLLAESLLVPILWLLAIATNFTVLQRVRHVRRLLRSANGHPPL
jgi:CDP-diacylglycerol--glycerol-3-phosphate 3-phosphatidyltransferase